jgi:hypothetical protein
LLRQRLRLRLLELRLRLLELRLRLQKWLRRQRLLLLLLRFRLWHQLRFETSLLLWWQRFQARILPQRLLLLLLLPHLLLLQLHDGAIHLYRCQCRLAVDVKHRQGNVVDLHTVLVEEFAVLLLCVLDCPFIGSGDEDKGRHAPRQIVSVPPPIYNHLVVISAPKTLHLQAQPKHFRSPIAWKRFLLATRFLKWVPCDHLWLPIRAAILVAIKVTIV